MKTSEQTFSSTSPALANRLNMHFVACSAAVACVAGVATPPEAQGAVVYSGVQNLALPAVGGGQLYLNIVSGATASAAAGLADWDIAPYGGGVTNQSSYALFTVANGLNSANLAPGTLINGSSTFFAGTGGVQTVDIADGTTGTIGFKFNPASTDGFTPGANGTPTNFGWFRLSVDTVGGGKIVDWAYESTPGVGITTPVPEPSALGCLALGAMGLAAMRRRRAAQAA